MRLASWTFLGLTLSIAGMTLAQPCDDWTGTMPPPVSHPGIFGKDILAHDDLVLVADDSLLVYDLANSPQPIGRCALPATNDPRPRLREVDGMVYVFFAPFGILRLDLTDPTDPTWQTAFAPDTSVRDFAAFSDGVVVVSAPGDIYVLDSLEPDGQVIAHVSGGIDDNMYSVVAFGHTACVGGSGFAVIDLTNPALPVISDRTLPFNVDHIGLRSIVMSEDRAVAVAKLYYYHDFTSETSLYAFNLDDPPGSPPAAIQPISAGISDLKLIGDRLVGATPYYLLVYSWPELVIEAAAAHPRAFARRPELAILDMTVLLMDTGGPHVSEPLLAYPLGADVVVPPVATLPGSYEPADCGRFGRTLHSETNWSQYDYEWWGTSTFEVYDQQDPLDPIAIHTLECAISDHRSCTHEFIGPHDRWAVIKCAIYEVDHGDNPVVFTQQIFAIDPASNRFPLVDVWGGATGRVVGDILWTFSDTYSGGDAHVEAFNLAGDVPVSYGSQFVGYALGPPYIANDVMLLRRSWTSLAAYSIADPAHIEFRGTTELPYGVNDLQWAGDDYLLIATTNDGIAVLEVVSDGDLTVVARGQVLGQRPIEVAVRDDLVAVGNTAGWGLVSIADPDAPVVLSETLGQNVAGFVWSDDYLYVGVPGGMYLYDVADPTTPVFVGQLAGDLAFGKPCAKDYYLMKGNGVFPRDCADPLSSEGGPPEQDLPIALPGAVALHPVAPNPFNPRMTVTFDLPQPERVSITIHDLRGRRVATLVEAEGVAGRQSVTWMGLDERGEPLPSGTYLVRLATASAVRTVKAVLVR